jgi:hypothetical protein
MHIAESLFLPALNPLDTNTSLPLLLCAMAAALLQPQKKCTPLLQEVKHFAQSYPAYSAYRGLVSSKQRGNSTQQQQHRQRQPLSCTCDAYCMRSTCSCPLLV